MDYIIGQKPPATRAAAPPLRPAGAAATPAPTGGAEPMIVDGDQRTFMADVIEASRSIPVLVDFWATWCGPCKQLTPALERVTTAAGGRLKLVKIDIDKNKALVRAAGPARPAAAIGADRRRLLAGADRRHLPGCAARDPRSSVSPRLC